MKVFVGNLSNKVSKYDLKDMFEMYGKVVTVKLMVDSYKENSKGYAVVEMENMHEARNAICELNGRTLQSKRIVVNEARDDNYQRTNNYSKYKNGNY
ncbi:MAG: RNA-binding protein [Bacteroidales bacterium]|nr:RNA-binding protein [Bacteroidales bacterium]